MCLNQPLMSLNEPSISLNAPLMCLNEPLMRLNKFKVYNYMFKELRSNVNASIRTKSTLLTQNIKARQSAFLPRNFFLYLVTVLRLHLPFRISLLSGSNCVKPCSSCCRLCSCTTPLKVIFSLPNSSSSLRALSIPITCKINLYLARCIVIKNTGARNIILLLCFYNCQYSVGGF